MIRDNYAPGMQPAVLEHWMLYQLLHEMHADGQGHGWITCRPKLNEMRWKSNQFKSKCVLTRGLWGHDPALQVAGKRGPWRKMMWGGCLLRVQPCPPHSLPVTVQIGA